VRMGRCEERVSKAGADADAGAGEVARRLAEDGTADAALQGMVRTLSAARAERIERALAARTKAVTAVLDNVDSVFNIAAICRSCDAFGVHSLHHISAREDFWSPRAETVREPRLTELLLDPAALKVSKGASKWVHIEQHESAAACVATLQKDGYRVLVSAVAQSDVRPLTELDAFASGRVALVFGNEHDGVSSEMAALADGTFTVAMQGFVESLNVSVAVAVAMHSAYFRARSVLSDERFCLALADRRKLLRKWLVGEKMRVRFAQRHSMADSDLPALQGGAAVGITQIGARYERLVLEQGVFEPAPLVMVLGANSGARLRRYVQKRKNGAMGDTSYAKRCSTVRAAVAAPGAVLAAHAMRRITAAPAVGDSFVARALRECSPRRLQEYFDDIVDAVGARFEELFDCAGSAFAPHAPDSAKRLSKARSDCISMAVPALVRFCADFFVSNTEDNNATLVGQDCQAQSLVQCILGDKSVLRKHVQLMLERNAPSLTASEVVGEERMDTARLEEILRSVDRYGLRTEYLSNLIESTTPETSLEEHRATACAWETSVLVELALRLAHAAWQAGELHTAAWERTQRASVKRLWDPRLEAWDVMLATCYADTRAHLPTLSPPHAHALAVSRVHYEVFVVSCLLSRSLLETRGA